MKGYGVVLFKEFIYLLYVIQILSTCLEDLGLSHHKYGTMITIEGPRFSSKAESKLWRSWGAHVINMSTVPEVKVEFLLKRDFFIRFHNFGQMHSTRNI